MGRSFTIGVSDPRESVACEEAVDAAVARLEALGYRVTKEWSRYAGATPEAEPTEGETEPSGGEDADEFDEIEDYRELQTLAKEAGVKASGSADAIRDRLRAHQADGGTEDGEE